MAITSQGRTGRHGRQAGSFPPEAKVTTSSLLEVTTGEVAFVLTRDGLEVRRRAEVYASKN
jgi:hypothetical protein